MDLYKAVKNPKSKTKSTSEPTPVLFSMGYIDLIFKIKLTDKDLFKTEEEQKKEENPENEEEKENIIHSIYNEDTLLNILNESINITKTKLIIKEQRKGGPVSMMSKIRKKQY